MRAMRVWISAAMLAVLAACGGGSADKASTPTDRPLHQPSESALTKDRSQFNQMDAVVTSPYQASTKMASLEVSEEPVPSVVSAVSGISVDLGEPPSSELTKASVPDHSGPRILATQMVRIGHARPIQSVGTQKSSVNRLTWQTLADGVQRARLNLRSAGANSLRVGLLVSTLDDAASIRVYGNSDTKALRIPGRLVNVSLAANVRSDGDTANSRTYWLPPTAGDSVVVEIDVPAARDAQSTVLAVTQVMHRTSDALQAVLQPSQKSTCPAVIPDATCKLTPAANAATTMDIANGTSNYVCSGTLVANRGTTQEGYILTADHCISTQTIASTVATYWFYRSSTCDGSSVNPGWKLVAGGATLRYNRSAISSYTVRNGQYYVTSDGTDTSLIDLNSAPPAGALYAGWALQRHLINSGVPYVDLHYPAGGWLRRSEGLLSNYVFLNTTTTGYYGTNDQYPMYEVDWTSGTTEYGSSGSGLLADEATTNPKIIGQLWGGTASCTNPNGKSYFGRFDLAYENGLSRWLNPGYTMVFRFYNTLNGAHFFSADVGERDNVRANIPTLAYEGPAFMVSPTAGTNLSPVYRFFNRISGVHFYTISEQEKASVLTNANFVFEGIAWYARQANNPSAETTPVYRFFRRSTGTHLYTINAAERDTIIATLSNDYIYEGVAYLAWLAN